MQEKNDSGIGKTTIIAPISTDWESKKTAGHKDRWRFSKAARYEAETNAACETQAKPEETTKVFWQFFWQEEARTQRGPEPTEHSRLLRRSGPERCLELTTGQRCLVAFHLRLFLLLRPSSPGRRSYLHPEGQERLHHPPTQPWPVWHVGSWSTSPGTAPVGAWLGGRTLPGVSPSARRSPAPNSELTSCFHSTRLLSPEARCRTASSPCQILDTRIWSSAGSAPL